jgi:hypothetical protein
MTIRDRDWISGYVGSDTLYLILCRSLVHAGHEYHEFISPLPRHRIDRPASGSNEPCKRDNNCITGRTTYKIIGPLQVIDVGIS